MTASHFSFDSMRAKPTLRLTWYWSRRIRADVTGPYAVSMFSRSFSVIWTGRLAKYTLVGSCSCCYISHISLMRSQCSIIHICTHYSTVWNMQLKLSVNEFSNLGAQRQIVMLIASHASNLIAIRLPLPTTGTSKCRLKLSFSTAWYS